MNKELGMKQWQGFLRKDGRKGIRNKVLVIYTVECASFVAQSIAREFADADVECIGFSGCTDNEYAIHMLIALIRHPNVGGVLVVGLGCEYVQPEWLSEKAREAGKYTNWLFIQNEGGTVNSIKKGTAAVRSMLLSMKTADMAEMTLSDLVVGAECGGSDYTSGLAGNVVVGNFFDMLVDSGGTAVFEEIVEAIGLKTFLTDRAAGTRAADELAYTYDKALSYCKSVRQYSISPGNFAGGLSTIEEKSMGALIKSGSRPIQGVLKVGGIPPRRGLWLLDSTPDPYWMQFGITNPNDSEGLMDLISCGCQITFLVTGRGSVIGSAVAPVIKITGNSITYKKMEGDMDFDAGRVLEGSLSPEQLVQELEDMVCAIAAGKKTKSEALGHKEYFIPYKFQEKSVLPKQCENRGE
jgi:altronate dehydratase large subunit